jgi:hypothetical protein
MNINPEELFVLAVYEHSDDGSDSTVNDAMVWGTFDTTEDAQLWMDAQLDEEDLVDMYVVTGENLEDELDSQQRMESGEILINLPYEGGYWTGTLPS